MNRSELAEFLIARRTALTPADVGLPAGERRRTPGLRREEVATLTGMSTDYYARLEQQRGPQPSEQMVSALARGLRLTLDEREHLFRLAGHNPPRRLSRSSFVHPTLLRVLDRLDDTPALVISDTAETLAQNRLGMALMGDNTGFTGLQRSAFYRWFTDSAARRIYPARDHEHQSRVQAAGLRFALGIGGADGRAAEIVHALLSGSPEFRDVWRRQEVAARFDDHKTISHSELGDIEVDCQALSNEDQSQTLLVLTAAPGSPSAEKLKLLGVVAGEQFAVTE